MKKKMQRKTVRVLLVALCLYSGLSSHAQSVSASRLPDSPSRLPDSPQPNERSIEDLNFIGGAAAMPPFSDSLIELDSAFRQAMSRKGMAFRVITQPQYAQNLLASPVPADDQVYVGQRWFAGDMIQPIFTADLRQLHLRQTQFYTGGIWNWVSWNPAGPKALQLWDLYLLKSFGESRRLEIKAGYVSNNMNFVGFFVGGSTATGAQGVYAVLPYEVGLSYFPLTAPSFNVRVHGPKGSYLNSALQRSLDPKGGPTEVARNHTGFRFDPHGDKLFVINEGGYQRAAAADAHEAWLRIGYMVNTTAYKNLVTGQVRPGNHGAYVLMDDQLTRPDPQHPAHGLYAGGSFITVPQSVNAYARYYELRAYKEAPFRSRPGDVLSAVASRTSYSSPYTDRLVSEGKSVWRAGTTLTGSYSLHTSPGNYISLGLSYVDGPAITPRVSNALNVIANWTLFF